MWHFRLIGEDDQRALTRLAETMTFVHDPAMWHLRIIGEDDQRALTCRAETKTFHRWVVTAAEAVHQTNQRNVPISVTPTIHGIHLPHHRQATPNFKAMMDHDFVSLLTKSINLSVK